MTPSWLEGTIEDMAATDPLDALLREAKAGDRLAFDRLIGHFERDVLKTAFFLTRNWHDAEDVAQEVYVRIFRKLGSLQDDRRIRSWVLKMTSNAARDLLRRRKLWEPVEKLLGRTAMFRDEIEAEQIRGRLAVALGNLSFKERACFVFRELHEIESVEVARIVGCSPTTVRSHLMNARRKMRDYLENIA